VLSSCLIRVKSEPELHGRIESHSVFHSTGRRTALRNHLRLTDSFEQTASALASEGGMSRVVFFFFGSVSRKTLSS
jgi:hypothetical protein